MPPWPQACTCLHCACFNHRALQATTHAMTTDVGTKDNARGLAAHLANVQCVSRVARLRLHVGTYIAAPRRSRGGPLRAAWHRSPLVCRRHTGLRLYVRGLSVSCHNVLSCTRARCVLHCTNATKKTLWRDVPGRDDAGSEGDGQDEAGGAAALVLERTAAFVLGNVRTRCCTAWAQLGECRACGG